MSLRKSKRAPTASKEETKSMNRFSALAEELNEGEQEEKGGEEQADNAEEEYSDKTRASNARPNQRPRRRIWEA